MAEVIDLTKYIKKREERELDELAQKLADTIEELGLTSDFEMYMADQENYIYGLPYIYTVYPPDRFKQADNLSDITDILTSLVIKLDGLGYSRWANQVSNVVGEMFLSGTFKEV
jgi:hypothetical protein